jgi:hypothetical protein
VAGGEVALQLPDDVRGVRADAAQHRGRDAGLTRHADVAQAGHRAADATTVCRPAVWLEGLRGQEVECRAVAGAEDDGVDVLARAVGQRTPSTVRVVNIGRCSGRPAASAAVYWPSSRTPTEAAARRPSGSRSMRLWCSQWCRSTPSGRCRRIVSGDLVARDTRATCASSTAIWMAELPPPTTTTRFPVYASGRR